MHRDIYDRFKETPFNPEAALSIWRHIISASTSMESRLTVAAPKALCPLVGAYFGDYTPCEDWQGNTLPADAQVLCLPFPTQENHTLWNPVLESEQPWRIFSYAPLVASSTTPTALLVAQIDAEPSGDDVSYFVGSAAPDYANKLEHGIWSVNGYKTEHEDARFLGAHATPILRME